MDPVAVPDPASFDDPAAAAAKRWNGWPREEARGSRCKVPREHGRRRPVSYLNEVISGHMAWPHPMPRMDCTCTQLHGTPAAALGRAS